MSEHSEPDTVFMVDARCLIRSRDVARCALFSAAICIGFDLVTSTPWYVTVNKLGGLITLAVMLLVVVRQKGRAR